MFNTLTHEKMKTNITISISNLGKAVGTLGWVSECLKSATVKICPSKKGKSLCISSLHRPENKQGNNQRDCKDLQ